jgi:predicted chitinase
MITLEQLSKIVPYCSTVKRREYIDPLNAAMSEFEINTPLRVAAFIAQVAHESGSFRYFKEIASGAAYERRKDLGNTFPEAIAIAKANGTTPGRWFKGHGPIQITGYVNHRECGKALGLDLLNKPGLITLPKDGFRSAAWFWKSKGLNELADKQEFDKITKRINGGFNGKRDRDQFYAVAKQVLKI